MTRGMRGDFGEREVCKKEDRDLSRDSEFAGNVKVRGRGFPGKRPHVEGKAV